MTAEVFLDTNILLYAASSSPADAAKRSVAQALIEDGKFGISAQVMQEFIANALRNRGLGLKESNMDAMLELSEQVPVVAISRELIVHAVALRRQHQLSHWDSTILAAAQELQCHTLYSEDFQHGRKYDEIRIRNPFVK